MQHTVFDTPGLNTLLRWCSVVFLKLTGWEAEGELPANGHRCVLIAAPHTSNWDLPYTLMTAFVLGLKPYWLGKASIFKPPFGGVMRWLGGMSVERSQTNNLVASAVHALKSADGPMQLIVPPEGTRGKTSHWRTGLYYIAIGAEVPILMAYLDYSRKRAGLGPAFVPTGDIERDMVTIKAFYAPVKGKFPQQFDAQ